MKYLILIVSVCTALNAFAGGRINPFTGQPLTYSLSEMHAREAMGAGAYDRMRVQMWALQQQMRGLHNHRSGYQFGDGSFGMDIRWTADATCNCSSADAYGAVAAWTTGAAYEIADWFEGGPESALNNDWESDGEKGGYGMGWSIKTAWEKTKW